jgi:hypothetical protein
MDRNITTDLVEAYASIYSSQEESQFLSEDYDYDDEEVLLDECYIAAQYFAEQGLNEYGVEALIEELGLNEFVDYVCEIVDEYTLTEARRGPGGTQVRIEPVTDKGKPYKGGKPTKAGLKRLRALKAARQEGEEKASASRPSGMRAALHSQSNTAADAKKGPSVVDRIAGAVRSGVERHNKAMNTAGEVAKVAGKAAGLIGKHVLKPAAAGFFGTLSGAGHVAAKGLKKEEVEYLLYYLMTEGYASTAEDAIIILENMSDLWVNTVLTEAYQN